MCDVKAGYVLRFLVYTGATLSLAQRKELGYAGSVVADLLADFLEKGTLCLCGQAQCYMNFCKATEQMHAELCKSTGKAYLLSKRRGRVK